MAPSEQFLRIYRTLPPESRQAFVEEHLAPLLDGLPTKRSARIIRDAKRSRTRCDGIPVLDFRVKKREIQTLLAILAKDDKVAFTRERSNREEILEEVVHSLSSWMNKIWVTVYEFKVNFDQAHECLLYALKSLVGLEDNPSLGDCKCLYKNMHVAIVLKDAERRTMKYFSFVGPHRLDEVCLWIWRDLFLTMLMEDRNTKSRVREMLGDIENIMGWQGLERVLRGGSRKSPLVDEEDEDEFDDEDLMDEEEDIVRAYEEICTDEELDSDDDMDTHICRFHRAKYWPDEIDEEFAMLCEVVKSRLIDIFRDSPEPDLFGVINVISQDPTSRTMKQMSRILSEIAGQSADSFKSALCIYTGLLAPWKILELLESHYDYLRPSDHTILVPAIVVLASSEYRQKALKFIERELLDSVQQFYTAISSVFSHFGEGPNKADLAGILKLPLDAPSRTSRIEGWVERSLTSNRPEPAGPMAFAAMMMGLPVGPTPSAIDETDFLAYIDLSKPDPDLDDLRDELKPPLKPRFEQWYRYAQAVARDSPQLLHKVYAKIIELMPFFKSNDVVKAMMNWLADRPSKSHIHEGMSAFLTFCKDYREKQRRRYPNQKKTKQKATGSQHQIPISSPAPITSNVGSAGSGTPVAFGPAPPPPPLPTGPTFHIFSSHGSNPGGMTTTSFTAQGNNPLTMNNPPAPTFGGAHPPFIPPTPPECTHQ